MADLQPKVVKNKQGEVLAFKRRFSNTYWIPPEVASSNNPTVVHENCPVKLHICDGGPHYARFDCSIHHTFIKWATKEEADLYTMIRNEKRKALMPRPAAPVYQLPEWIGNSSGGFGTGSISNS